MFQRIQRRLQTLTWAHRFFFASLVILIVGMTGIGAWIGREIETGVVNRTAATTALYVDSLIASNLQDLKDGDSLTPEHMERLKSLQEETALGQQIASFKVWTKQGRVVYSTDPTIVGQTFPIEDDLNTALRGQVSASLSNLQKVENVFERQRANGKRLLEIYSPVRLQGTNEVIAAAEFYQYVNDLEVEIGTAQQRSWLLVGVATLLMYLLLAGFVQRASNTIEHQRQELSNQVARLRELLQKNLELDERVRRAAAHTAALNERMLRRISAELHDGPAQDLGLALLKLDHVFARAENGTTREPNGSDGEDLDIVRSSLDHALKEMRAISAGMGLPELSKLSLTDALVRVVRAHERRTGTTVNFSLGRLPDQAPLPVKITSYRLVQEALLNAYRHGGASDQRADARFEFGELVIEISDHGPGFDAASESGRDEHLGLAGMRERVESLGGVFQLETERGQGTRVIARLPIHAGEASNGYV